jgi:serine/arginine repetitive matrix protein 2
MRAQEADAGKTSGTIFVKGKCGFAVPSWVLALWRVRHSPAVLGIESFDVPLPEQDTFFCVTLDNGIDYIRTPYTVLKDGARVNQEFSL